MFKTIRKWFGKKKVVRRLVKDQSHYQQFITDENKGEVKTHISPFGRYGLQVTEYKTGKGTWDITHAKLVRLGFHNGGGNYVITEFIRNYHSFPFMWIRHPTDTTTYLICGRDYQGYDVINCDTDRVMTHLPTAALKGFGFCHSDYCEFDSEKLTLKVYGCYWGCPYEMRVYDFSDPEENFPLPILEERSPTLEERKEWELDDDCKACSVWADPKSDDFGKCDDRCIPEEKLDEMEHESTEKMKTKVLKRLDEGWQPCQKVDKEHTDSYSSNYNLWYLKRGQKFKLKKSRWKDKSRRKGKQESMCCGESNFITQSGEFKSVERAGVIFWEII